MSGAQYNLAKLPLGVRSICYSYMNFKELAIIVRSVSKADKNILISSKNID